MAAESDVFLIDHAWTFRFQDAVNTLKQNPALTDRIHKMVDDIEKQDLPEQASEEKKEDAAPTVEQAFLKAMESGGTEFDLDNLGLTTLMNLPEFPE